MAQDAPTSNSFFNDALNPSQATCHPLLSHDAQKRVTRPHHARHDLRFGSPVPSDSPVGLLLLFGPQLGSDLFPEGLEEAWGVEDRGGPWRRKREGTWRRTSLGRSSVQQLDSWASSLHDCG